MPGCVRIGQGSLSRRGYVIRWAGGTPAASRQKKSDARRREQLWAADWPKMFT